MSDTKEIRRHRRDTVNRRVRDLDYKKLSEKDHIKIIKIQKEEKGLEAKKDRKNDTTTKRISKVNHLKIVSIQKEEKKDVEVKKNKRNNLPREPMGDTKSLSNDKEELSEGKNAQNEIPKDLFHREDNGYYHCDNINLVKKIYETQESFPEIESYLKSQGCKDVPCTVTIRNLVIKSFKSYSEYKTWKNDIKLRKVPEEKRKTIIETGTAENHGSLRSLAEEFDVAIRTTRKILVKAKGEDWVKEEYPPPPKIPDEKREAVIKAGTVESHGSLISMAEEFKTSIGSIRSILVKAKGEDWVKEEYPHPEISGEKRKTIKEAGTAEKHGSLGSLAEEFDVDKSTARKILVKAKGEDWVKEEYPPPPKIPDEKKEAVIEAGTAEGHGSLISMAEEFNISKDSIRSILVKVKGEDWVKEEFPQDLPKVKGTLTHNLVKSHITKVFDERRKYSPEVPEMISEPQIYSGSFKCADIGFKNIPNYLRILLSKNDLFQRLNIEPESIEHIEVVQFDFTNLVTKKNIINKATKYQHHKVLTIIVGTSWRKKVCTINLPNVKAIMYPENIKVISYELFADLLDLQGAERDEFMEIIKLNEGNKIEALQEMWEMRKNQELHYAKKDLIGFLDNNANLDFWMK